MRDIERPGVDPPNDYPDYVGTRLRAPKEPLVLLPHTLSELTGPVYGERAVGELDDDLTRQHAGEPLGERIVVSGRVLGSDGKPLRGQLVEIWQANAAGRYHALGRQARRAARPELHRGGPLPDRRRRRATAS